MSLVKRSHAGFKANDPQGTAAFYMSVFELVESNRVETPHGLLIFLGDEEEHHRLVFEETAESIDVSTVNQISLGTDSEQDFLQIKKRLEDKGVSIEQGPFLHRKYYPEYPGDSGSLSMYFTGPEDYWNECYVPKEFLAKDIEDRYPICPY